MRDISDRLYISTVSHGAAALARQYGSGLELAEFCTAANMDSDFELWDGRVKREMRGISRRTFHAPFNELCPAAVDPMAAAVARKRYAQAYALMDGYGIERMIVHSGFIPMVYYEEWFVEKSALFWTDFLRGKSPGFRLYMENVLEPSPDMLTEIVRAVNDTRFKICLDIGHAAVAGPDVPISEWTARTLPFLGHVHLHNNYGKYDSHNAPGDGIIDVASCIRTVTESEPCATFTIEAIDGEASFKWLQAEGLLKRKTEVRDR